MTDEKYFEGSLNHLKSVRKVTKLPILRKDFIIDNYQIVESKNAGVDCILLIMAALEKKHAKELGVKGVPCFIINKKFVLFGAQTKENFINIFDSINDV